MKRIVLLPSIIFTIVLFISFVLRQSIVVNADDNNVLSFRTALGSYVNDVTIHNGLAYVSSFEKIEIYSTDNTVDLVGSVTVPGCYFDAIEISDGFAYATELQHACDGNFYVFDVNNPDNPQIYSDPITTSSTPGQAISITGAVVYLASAQDGLVSVDISDPRHPEVLSEFVPHNGFVYRDLDVDSNTVYLANSTGGYAVIDVTELSNPILINEVDIPSTLADYHSNAIALDDEYLYLAGGERLIKIFDQNNSEVYVSEKSNTWSTDIEIANNYMFVIDRDFGVRVFDISEASNPQAIWAEEVEVRVKGVSVSSDKAFVFTDTGSVYIYDVNIDVEESVAFLDLPWDYRAQGKTFTEAALSMSSYFDHEYPLVSATNLLYYDKSAVVNYKGQKSNSYSYSSHDGYDWGRVAGTKYGVPQIAAADGLATYIDSCGACGNAIHIDHGNGYQTRYYHLQKSGLITSSAGVSVPVTRGQQIGLTGFSGNTYPSDERGSHVHFMVIQDKDTDGDFDDNIPDGLVDPFGWLSHESDPWETFTFEQNAIEKVGNMSQYLWTQTLGDQYKNVADGGGEYDYERYKVIIPEDAYTGEFTLNLSSSPVITLTDSLNSISPTLVVLANNDEEDITQFESNLTIFFDFNDMDLSEYELSTLQIYSSQDGVEWIPEETNIDFENKIASVNVSHLTEFALFAERKDITPPMTEIVINGDQKNGEYYSDVEVHLVAIDEKSEIAYTAISIDDEPWTEYEQSFVINEIGEHTINYYSEDSFGNVEEVQTTTFVIAVEKEIPEVAYYYDADENSIIFSSFDEKDTVETTYLPKSRFETRVTSGVNTLTVKGRYHKGFVTFITVDTLEYDGNTVKLDNNSLTVVDSFIFLNQTFRSEDKYIRIFSNKHRGDTIVITGVGRNRERSFINDIVYLYIQTDDGLLNYSYEQ